MLSHTLTKALPVISFLHFVQEQICTLSTSLWNLAPVFFENVIEQRCRSRLETIIGKVEIEHVIARHAAAKQVAHKLESIKRLSATPNSRNDMNQVEYGRRRKRPHDVSPARQNRQLKFSRLLHERRIVLKCRRHGVSSLLACACTSR